MSWEMFDSLELVDGLLGIMESEVEGKEGVGLTWA